MDQETRQFLSACSSICFGQIILSDEERGFCNGLNNEIFRLDKSLPPSTQSDALLFLMNCSSTAFGGTSDFLRICYVPTWSILYWLIQSCPSPSGIDKNVVKDACTAHSLAIFLHYLDDHLNDGQMSVTHLTLLLRSQSWMLMNEAWYRLADGDVEGEETIQHFLDDYYSSICSRKGTGSLAEYCNLFRKQMATGLITPMLLARRMDRQEGFPSAVQGAYCSFGIAWRLLDDINDLEEDMMSGRRSAVYICLSDEMKSLWNEIPGVKSDRMGTHLEAIVEYLRKNHVIDRLKVRLCNELDSAASIADDSKLGGLAEEFRCLLRPLRNG